MIFASFCYLKRISVNSQPIKKRHTGGYTKEWPHGGSPRGHKGSAPEHGRGHGRACRGRRRRRREREPVLRAMRGGVHRGRRDALLHVGRLARPAVGRSMAGVEARERPTFGDGVSSEEKERKRGKMLGSFTLPTGTPECGRRRWRRSGEEGSTVAGRRARRRTRSATSFRRGES